MLKKFYLFLVLTLILVVSVSLTSCCNNGNNGDFFESETLMIDNSQIDTESYDALGCFYGKGYQAFVTQSKNGTIYILTIYNDIDKLKLHKQFGKKLFVNYDVTFTIKYNDIRDAIHASLMDVDEEHMFGLEVANNTLKFGLQNQNLYFSDEISRNINGWIYFSAKENDKLKEKYKKYL